MCLFFCFLCFGAIICSAKNRISHRNNSSPEISDCLLRCECGEGRLNGILGSRFVAFGFNPNIILIELVLFLFTHRSLRAKLDLSWVRISINLPNCNFAFTQLQLFATLSLCNNSCLVAAKCVFFLHNCFPWEMMTIKFGKLILVAIFGRCFQSSGHDSITNDTHTNTHSFWQFWSETFCVAALNLKCNLNAFAIATATDNDYGADGEEQEQAQQLGLWLSGVRIERCTLILYAASIYRHTLRCPSPYTRVLIPYG